MRTRRSTFNFNHCVAERNQILQNYPPNRCPTNLDPTCAICFENLSSEVAILYCGHRYHSNCIDAWVSSRPEHFGPCPTCRLNIIPEYVSFEVFPSPPPTTTSPSIPSAPPTTTPPSIQPASPTTTSPSIYTAPITTTSPSIHPAPHTTTSPSIHPAPNITTSPSIHPAPTTTISPSSSRTASAARYSRARIVRAPAPPITRNQARNRARNRRRRALNAANTAAGRTQNRLLQAERTIAALTRQVRQAMEHNRGAMGAIDEIELE